MAKLIKYMGTADEATVPKGTDFGGTVKEPTSVALVFDKSNKWVVDAEEAGLTQVQIDALLEDSDRFKDVTDMQRIPFNAHQKTFHPTKAQGASEAKVSEAASTVSDAGTTAGGSTEGDTAGTSSRRRGATT